MKTLQQQPTPSNYRVSRANMTVFPPQFIVSTGKQTATASMACVGDALNKALDRNAELEEQLEAVRDEYIQLVDWSGGEIESLKLERKRIEGARRADLEGFQIVLAQKDEEIEGLGKALLDAVDAFGRENTELKEQIALLEIRLGIREDVEAGSLDSMEEPF